ncbi:MAG: hypothetical protein HRU32_12600 [Rhodobacteraceae bacterium]|nr:hypothetical protein [Paracoccaceae bacterium]
MPKLIEMYIRHTLIGFAIAAVFVGLLLGFNVMNLWHLVTHAPGGWLAAFLLFMFNGIVFSGVQFGIAIMSLGEEKDDRPAGSAPAPILLAEPIPVRVHRGK